MRRTHERPAPPAIVVELRGGVAEDLVEYAGKKISRVLPRTGQPVLRARARVTRHGDPARERPVVAQANVDVNGRFVRDESSATNRPGSWGHPPTKSPRRLHRPCRRSPPPRERRPAGTLTVAGRAVGPADLVAPVLPVVAPHSQVVPPSAVLPVHASFAAIKQVLEYGGDTRRGRSAPGRAGRPQRASHPVAADPRLARLRHGGHSGGAATVTGPHRRRGPSGAGYRDHRPLSGTAHGATIDAFVEIGD
jgi:hypothetical protein